MVTKKEGCEGGTDWDFGTGMYTPLFLWRDNQDSPDGIVDKNPPAIAGNMAKTFFSGPQKILHAVAHEPQVLSLCSSAGKSQLLKPAHSRAGKEYLVRACATTTEACAQIACALRQEKPVSCN